MDKVPWNPVIFREFVSLSYLTEEEEKILKTRIAGWNQAAQIHELNMSLATLNRKTRKLKDKYYSVVKYSKILPENLKF